MARTKRKGGAGLDAGLLQRAALGLRVMSHPHRLKMLELLLKEPVPVGDLAEAVGLPPAAVSQHLNILRSHGIVEPHRDGRHVYYEVVNPQAGFLIECLEKYAKHI